MKPEYIKQVREKSKMNIVYFAKRLDVSVVTVRNWEQGITEPNFMNQKRIRSAFRDECCLIDFKYV